MRYECYTKGTSATQVLHERHISAARLEHFDFDNDTSKNIFSHPYIYYIAGERLKEEEQIHS